MSIDLGFAQDIADEMRLHRQAQTWRKVTTILSAYGKYNLTTNARADLDKAFDDAELICAPSMKEVQRAGRVRLTPRNAAVASPAAVGSDGGLPVGVTSWNQGTTTVCDTCLQVESASLVIIDIDLCLVLDSSVIGRALPPRLNGLNEEILQDLITPDARAKFKRKSGDTRRASLFLVSSDPDEPHSHDKAIPLSLRLVEFAMGPGWLVMVRHAPQFYSNGSPSQGSQPTQSAAAYMNALCECGLDEATTSHAAALVVVTHALDSFSTTRENMASYLESWRTEFAGGSSEKQVLVDIQATLPIVVDALEPLLHPSVAEWVKSTSVEDAVPLRDAMLRGLDALHSLQGTTAAAIAQADQAQNEGYQRKLATLAAVFLAPALVASVFGANQVLEDSAQDLWWLIAGMIITGGVTGLVISRVLKPRSRRAVPRLPNLHGQEGAPRRRLRGDSTFIADHRKEARGESPVPLAAPRGG